MDVTGRRLTFNVLGPLTVAIGSDRVDLGPARQRAVLAALLMTPNVVVSVDRLIDQVWPDPPPSAMGTLQAYVSNLRRALEPDRAQRAAASVLVTEAPGYRLVVDRSGLDSSRFEDHLAAARDLAGQQQWEAALADADRALGCWAGPALADFEHDDFTQTWRARLDELRAAAEELRVELLIRLGREPEAVAHLEELVALWPLRERFRTQQVVALARAGRQADALRAYDRARTQLVEELGIDPGPGLEDAYRKVLDRDESVRGSTALQLKHPVPVAAPPPRRLDSFVGRDGYVDRLLNTPRPGFALITGEAGIGKTRLAEEVIAEAEQRGCLVGFGRCHDDQGAPPLWPWRQVLADLGLDLLELVGSSDAYVDGAPEVFSRFEQVRHALTAASESRPIVVVLDDLQWADLTSLRLLSFLCTELRRGDTLIIVTVRDTDVGSDSPVTDSLARLARANSMQVSLRGLDESAVRRLVSEMIGRELDDASLARLIERTGGNPFYVGELARLWAKGPSDEVPEAISDVVRARLARLPESSRLMLLMAAAIGRTFDIGVLSVAVGDDRESVETALEAAVAQRLVTPDAPGSMRFTHALLAEALLADAGPVRIGRLHLRASDALVEARAGGVPISASQIARHLDNAAVMLGAEHAARAGDAAREAAIEASETGAFNDAARWWETAWRHGRDSAMSVPQEVDLLTQLAVARVQSGVLVGSDGATRIQHRAIALARSLPASQRYRALTEAAAISSRCLRTWQWRPPGQRDHVVIEALQTALDEVPEDKLVWRIRLLSSLAIELLSIREGPPQSQRLTAEAVALARRVGDIDLLARALLTRVLAFDVPGGRREQGEAVDEVLGLRDLGLSKLLLASAITWRLGQRIALAEGAIGYEQLGLELRALTDELHDPVLNLTSSWAASTLAFFRCDFALAHERAVLAYRRQQAFGSWDAVQLLVSHEALRLREVGQLPSSLYQVAPDAPNPEERRALDATEVLWSAWNGRIDEAAALVEHHAPRVLEWRGSGWMMWMAYVIEASCVASSDWLGRLYDEFLPFAGEAIFRWPYPMIGAVDHYLGLAARALHLPEVSVAHFDDATAIHQRIAAAPWEMRSRLESAESRASIEPVVARRLLDVMQPELDRLGLIDLAQRGRVLREQLAAFG
jgi:DNA-binding SARP family transcriptional activator